MHEQTEKITCYQPQNRFIMPSEPLNQKKKMHLLTTFLKKPPADRVLYLEATFWLAISRLAILILPFKWIAPFLGTHMAQTDTRDDPAQKETTTRVCRTIGTMSRHLPWECKCLAQAISGKRMLRRRHIHSTLYLGVAKKQNGDLNAHAWLRTGDTVVLGGGGLERFAVVSTFT